MSDKIKKLVIAAMFAALTCVATLINIPAPATQGYVNLGDGVVLLCGFMLGPIYGTAAAGIGSMLTDIVLGYPHYAPGTLAIKAAVALVGWLMYNVLKYVPSVLRSVFAGIIAETVMVLGYFGYSGFVLGYGIGAATSIPGNIVQGMVGVVIATVLYAVLYKNRLVKRHLIF